MNSPTTGMKTRSEPAIMPGNDRGRITLKKDFIRLTPKSLEASIKFRSNLFRYQ